ncbi:MAG: hypothetical protein JXA54_13215 [Candidatus Heimdallarchaeota archaeon]|nr:hypothetical protein [Candidatus Heimdallarchaeota archaeon]
MKAEFFISKEIDIMAKLDEVALKYDATVNIDEDYVSHFILVKPKLQIKQRATEDNYSIHVWGATEENLNYLKTIFGEPSQVTEERLTPLEFATELVAIPEVIEKTKEEIMILMDVDEKQYNQYKRLLGVIARKDDTPAVIKSALEILK